MTRRTKGASKTSGLAGSRWRVRGPAEHLRLERPKDSSCIAGSSRRRPCTLRNPTLASATAASGQGDRDFQFTELAHEWHREQGAIEARASAGLDALEAIGMAAQPPSAASVRSRSGR